MFVDTLHPPRGQIGFCSVFRVGRPDVRGMLSLSLGLTGVLPSGDWSMARVLNLLGRANATHSCKTGLSSPPPFDRGADGKNSAIAAAARPTAIEPM